MHKTISSEIRRHIAEQANYCCEYCLEEDQIIHSTLPKYVQAIKETHGELETFKGEMREDRHCQILAGTLSSRMYIKQENEKSQTLLEKYAEPASVMAWVLGKEYPQEYLRYAWKLLMQNHPHDSICGCSADQVHAEMMPRFAQVQQIGEELTNRALDFVASKVLMTEDANLFVFNPLNHDRSEVIEATVEFPLGPATRSGVHPIIEQATGTDVLSIEVVDDEGKIVPYQIVNTEIMACFRNIFTLFRKHFFQLFTTWFTSVNPSSETLRTQRTLSSFIFFSP